jgi:hypothetical protein
MSFAEDLQRQAKERRARLWSKPKLVEVVPEPSVEQPAETRVVPQFAVETEIKIPRNVLSVIMDEVAEKHGVTRRELISPSRKVKLVQARQEYFYRALAETNKSGVQISFHCGERDHTAGLWGAIAHCHRHNLPHPRGADVEKLVAKRKREAERCWRNRKQKAANAA